MISKSFGGITMGNYYFPFSLRIPEELLDKVKFIANENKRSANKELEFIIQSYVEDWEKKNKIIKLENK